MTAPIGGAATDSPGQTRRRFGGRQPLCAWGVTSLDRADLEAGGLERADRGLAARTRALDEDVDLLHAVLLRLAGGGLGGELRGERGRLARALEADAAGRGPADDGAGRVGDRDDRVVERRLDVGLAQRRCSSFPCGAACARRVLGAAMCSSPESCRTARGGGYLRRPSSCRRRCASGPCGCARWSSCADRARAGRGGGGCPGSSRSRPCGGCRRRPRGAGHPRPCSCPRCSRGARRAGRR